MKCTTNYPNPFRSSTRIEYNIPRTSKVGIKIFNETGDLVYRLMTHMQTAGKKFVTWNGRNVNGQQVPFGRYFYVIRIDDCYEISNEMSFGS